MFNYEGFSLFNTYMFECLTYYSCVIAELFTEGSVPFDLSQLLAYRTGEYNPLKLLEKIEDKHIRVGLILSSKHAFLTKHLYFMLKSNISYSKH